MAKKKNDKPTIPLSVNETLYVCRLCKLYGVIGESMPSARGGTFNAVKLKGGDMSKKNVKCIQDAFKERYDKTLYYETSTISNLGYLTL